MPKGQQTLTQYSNESKYGAIGREPRDRGLTVYSSAQLQRITGRDKEGRLLQHGWEQPYFYLTVEQRVEMFRLCTPIFGVVTSRMNRMAGLQYTITTEKKAEEKTVSRLKELKSIYDEYKTSLDLAYITMKAMIVKEIRSTLPEIMPDLSNFESSLLRWKKRLRDASRDITTEAEDWLKTPNQGLTWEEWLKKWVFDMHIHGAASIYKQVENGSLQNFDVLPGGTVYKIRDTHFSTMAGYVQVIPGFAEPGIYFEDEMIYTEFVPTSARSYGFVPLEALINKIAETLLFDNLMANQADGTAPPEKVVVVTNNNPFGSMDVGEKSDMPLDADEQSRIEEKINTPIKGKIMTFTGNHAEILDLSRENTMSIQNQRQKDIREDVALVFNMSNMEINQSGSEDTSGRSTSDAQADIEQGKGIAPLAKIMESIIGRQILPFRFPPGLIFEFQKSKSEMEEKQLDMLMLQTGEMTKNEIREKYDKAGFGTEYDKPDGAQQGDPGANQVNPLFTRNV